MPLPVLLSPRCYGCIVLEILIRTQPQRGPPSNGTRRLMKLDFWGSQIPIYFKRLPNSRIDAFAVVCHSFGGPDPNPLYPPPCV
eukprot:3024345-Pyramimonas_sp.AAC.1